MLVSPVKFFGDRLRGVDSSPID